MNSPAGTQDAWARWNCTADPLSARQVWAMYERLGFLYPAKLERLAPVIDEVQATWEAALHSPEPLLVVARFGSPEAGPFASVATWRDGLEGWFAQHLVARSCPHGTAAVMLAMQDWRMESADQAQNWFRPSNRLPARVLTPAAANPATKAHNGRVEEVDLYELEALANSKTNTHLKVRVSTVSTIEEAQEFLRALNHPLMAEGIRGPKNLLRSDWQTRTRHWSGVGLTFDRWVRVARYAGRPVAVAIDYRGPLGLNFSFLENRLAVFPLPEANNEECLSAITALCSASRDERQPRHRAVTPVVLSSSRRGCLQPSGVAPYRTYQRTVWIGKEAMRGWRSSIYDRYARLLRRAGVGCG